MKIKDTLKGVIVELDSLKELSLSVNYKSASDRKKILDGTLIIKECYYGASCSLLNKRPNLLSTPALRLYIDRPIRPRQMYAWIVKIQVAVTGFLKEDNDNLDEQLSFIEKQNNLLDMIIKVLNGDARFVGC